MAHASSEGYALNILARLATNTKWSSISNERLKEVLNTSPTILGERFAEFLERHAVPRKIIAHTDTIMVPAVNSFSLLGSFYWQPGTATEVVISHVDHTFQDHFPKDQYTEEMGTPEAPVGVYELHYALRGTRVVEVLNAQEKRRSKLSTVWFFLQKQPRGEEGSLSLEESNVFLINDFKGVGKAVSIDWNKVDKGWGISIYTMKNSYRWTKGTRFFCPDVGL